MAGKYEKAMAGAVVAPAFLVPDREYVKHNPARAFIVP
jgi:hypothetical protein